MLFTQKRDQAFQERVEYSRKFYTLTLTDMDDCDNEPVFSLIKRAVLDVTVPATFVAMYRGFYWRRTVSFHYFPF